MATLPPDTPPPTDRSSGGGDRRPGAEPRRSAVPFFVSAVLAAAVLGWYSFAYVPPKLQYFVGLRFRTLAVAARQFKSKADNLSAALQTAVATIGGDSVAAAKNTAKTSGGDDVAGYTCASDAVAVPPVQSGAADAAP